MKGIQKTVFRTFAISIILSIVINLAYYSVSQMGRGYDYMAVLPLLVIGAIFLNTVLLVVSIPALFLSNNKLWANLPIRLAFYFLGPLIFVIVVIFSDLGDDKMFYLLTGIIFNAVHLIQYTKTIKKSS